MWSGSFERFLIQHGERVRAGPTKLMADTRRAARQRGKVLQHRRDGGRQGGAA